MIRSRFPSAPQPVCRVRPSSRLCGVAVVAALFFSVTMAPMSGADDPDAQKRSVDSALSQLREDLHDTEAGLWAKFLDEQHPDGAKVGMLVFNSEFGENYVDALTAALDGTPHEIVEIKHHEATAVNIDNDGARNNRPPVKDDLFFRRIDKTSFVNDFT